MSNNSAYPENYPVPDPSWDYAGVHLEAYRIREKIDKSIKYVSALENGSPEGDAYLIAEFEAAITQMQGVIALLKS